MKAFRTIIFALIIAVHLAPPALAAGKLDLAPADDGWTEPPHPGRASTFLTIAGLMVAGTAAIDHAVREDLFPFRHKATSVELRRFGDMGQLAGPMLGSAFLVQGLAFNNPTSRQTGFLAFQSFLVAGAASGVLKAAFGRERPISTDNSGHFFRGKTDGAFPSGHTTTAFAAATIFSEQYPRWYVVAPAFAAATAVGVSRLAANQHWTSDVVAGAALGMGVGHLLWKRAHRNDRRTSHLDITPGGVAWRTEFGGASGADEDPQ